MKDNIRDRSYVGAEAKAAARDRLIFNVTDDLLIVMEDNDVSKKELARRLGKSRSYVTQILSGRRNMTLGTFSDICFALKFEPKITLPITNEDLDGISVHYIPTENNYGNHIAYPNIHAENREHQSAKIIPIEDAKGYRKVAA